MPRKDLEARKEYSHQHYQDTKEQRREYDRNYAEKNAGKIREYNKQYREVNSQRFKAYEDARKDRRSIEQRTKYENDSTYREKRLRLACEWKTINKERNKSITEQWRIDNREYMLRYGKEYREENSEPRAEYAKKWREKNKDRMLAHAIRRQAIKKGSEGRFTASEITALAERQSWRCTYFSVCGNVLQPRGYNGMHRDHIEPLQPLDTTRKSGRNTIENIQLLCSDCNHKKKNKDPYLFTQQHAGMLFPDLPRKQKKASA